jgi:hypothetical protein
MGLFVALLSMPGVLAGFGGGSSTPTLPGAAGPLSSIPDTAAYRSFIAVNDLRTLWTSAGVRYPPSLAHLTHGTGLAVSTEIGNGSQIGVALWE